VGALNFAVRREEEEGITRQHYSPLSRGGDITMIDPMEAALMVSVLFSIILTHTNFYFIVFLSPCSPKEE
jgi:hypothetical protein